MNWILGIAGAWIVLSVAAGLALGRAIKRADERERGHV